MRYAFRAKAAYLAGTLARGGTSVVNLGFCRPCRSSVTGREPSLEAVIAKWEERDYCSICEGKFISQGLYFEGKQSLMSEREDETCRDRPSVGLKKKKLLVRGTTMED